MTDEDAVFVVGALLFAMCIAGLFAWGVANLDAEREHERQRCAHAGGHIVRKSVVNDTLRLCVSADGRLLDP